MTLGCFWHLETTLTRLGQTIKNILEILLFLISQNLPGRIHIFTKVFLFQPYINLSTKRSLPSKFQLQVTQKRRKSWSISVELTLNSKTKLQRVFIGNFSSWEVIGGAKDCRWCEMNPCPCSTPRAILQHHPKFGCLGSGNPKNVHKMCPLSELFSKIIRLNPGSWKKNQVL